MGQNLGSSKTSKVRRMFGLIGLASSFGISPSLSLELGQGFEGDVPAQAPDDSHP